MKEMAIDFKLGAHLLLIGNQGLAFFFVMFRVLIVAIFRCRKESSNRQVRQQVKVAHFNSFASCRPLSPSAQVATRVYSIAPRYDSSKFDRKIDNTRWPT